VTNQDLFLNHTTYQEQVTKSPESSCFFMATQGPTELEIISLAPLFILLFYFIFLFCLSLPSTGITGICHHTQPTDNILTHVSVIIGQENGMLKIKHWLLKFPPRVPQVLSLGKSKAIRRPCQPGTQVAHFCIPGYSRGRDQEDHDSKPAWGNRS
jgi:hypothetical protein